MQQINIQDDVWYDYVHETEGNDKWCAWTEDFAWVAKVPPNRCPSWDMGDRQRALHRALSDSDQGMITELLSLGDVDVNHREAACGLQTVLMRVCHVPMDCIERRNLIEKILQQAADVNLTDSTGRTAIAHACIAEKNDVIDILSALTNCDPNIADNDGNTPLLYAVKSRKPEVVRKLLTSFPKNSIDTDHRNNKGICALTEAEKHFDSEICRMLIKDGGADPSCLDGVQIPPRGGNIRSPRHSPPPLETIPTSPRIQSRKLKIRQRSDPCPPIMATNRLRTSDVLSPDYLTPDNMSLRKARSFDSTSTISQTDSIPEVEETEEETEESEENVTRDRGHLMPFIVTRQRRSSLSLPDLRIMPRFLISTPPHRSPWSSPRNSPRGSPRISPRGSFEEAFPRVGSPRCERSHTLDDVPPLPQLSEEDEDDAAISPTNVAAQRRGSKSLPDLRECRGFLLKLHQQACETTDDESTDKRSELSWSEKRKSFRKRSTKKPPERSHINNTLPDLSSPLGTEVQEGLINPSSPPPTSLVTSNTHTRSMTTEISVTHRRKFFSMKKT